MIKACAEAGFVPKIAQHAVQLDTILGLIAGGLGICLVPSALAKPPKGVVFHDVLALARLWLELSAAWRRDDDQPIVAAFLQTTRLVMATAD